MKEKRHKKIANKIIGYSLHMLEKKNPLQTNTIYHKSTTK
jgi:ribosomal protein S17E